MDFIVFRKGSSPNTGFVGSKLNFETRGQLLEAWLALTIG